MLSCFDPEESEAVLVFSVDSRLLSSSGGLGAATSDVAAMFSVVRTDIAVRLLWLGQLQLVFFSTFICSSCVRVLSSVSRLV